MNSVQLHLALTHVPVILSLVGLVMLILAFFIKSPTLTKSSYILIAIAGIAAIPVYFSGEGTEEAVENLPGVSENIIEKHEDFAKLAMISIVVAGLLAITAIFTTRWLVAARTFKVLVMAVAFVSGWLMTQTAHLGGQIRHTEIRNSATAQTENEAETESDGNKENEHEVDND